MTGQAGHIDGIRSGRRGMRAAVLFLALLVPLSGCGTIGNWFRGGAVADTALPFRARLGRGADRRDFTVSVAAGGATVPQVRESVRFEATRYCLNTFGGSDADWVLDPATGDWAFARDGEALVFSGRCTAR